MTRSARIGSWRLSDDVAAVAGLPESALAPDDLAALPDASPPGPWRCRARSVLWFQRADPPSFDWAGTPLPLAAGVFVDYLSTPVGPYREVLTGAFLRRTGGAVPRLQIPFIAVDSLPSVHGGRANWELPKTTATFDGTFFTGVAGPVTASASGQGWSVAVRTSRPGPPFPLASFLPGTGPLGHSMTVLRGIARLVVVHTEIDGPTLGGWLPAGRHVGLIMKGSMTVGAPRPPAVRPGASHSPFARTPRRR